LYHQALEALFSPDIVYAPLNRQKLAARKSCQSWWRSGAAYVGLHGFFG
jgi:hypothetical protein